MLPAGGCDDLDHACYTGSVIKAPNGMYHLFYTGQNPLNPDLSQEGKPLQYILHAVSNDLKVWEKHYETAFSAPKGIFEPHDWRDPFVFYQEESGEYYMLLAARLKGAKLPKKRMCCAVPLQRSLELAARRSFLFPGNVLYP